MMQKTKIDVDKSIRIMDTALDELKEGICNPNFTEADRDDIRTQLEDVIALAEQIKADIATDKIREKKA